MEKITFPNVVIVDISDITMEFMSVYKTGGEPLDNKDFCFIEEILTMLHNSFVDYANFDSEVREAIAHLPDLGIYYSDEDKKDTRIMLSAVYNYAHSIMERLTQHALFVNGFFPYVFKQLSTDYALIFEHGPEYIGDRYCDPNVSMEPKNNSMWL